LQDVTTPAPADRSRRREAMLGSGARQGCENGEKAPDEGERLRVSRRAAREKAAAIASRKPTKRAWKGSSR